MRITNENGKRYRAYSPDEFFSAPKDPKLTFYVNAPKPKKYNTKKSIDKTGQNSI